jgi:hypothetical protein
LDLATFDVGRGGLSIPALSKGGWKFRYSDEVSGSEPGGDHEPVWSDDSFDVVAADATLERFQLSYSGVADVSIDFNDKIVRVCPAAYSSQQSVLHLLGDQVLPRILAHEGELVLHAAGARTESGMVLFAGASGSGKSSLAASLHKGGYRLVGDDAIVISETGGKITGRAIYRSLRLFPDSIDALIPRSARLSPVASYTTKQNVAFADDCPSNETTPIRAAFLLGPTRGDAILIEPMNASDACMAIVEHSFWMDPADLDRTKKRMLQASVMARQIPMFRLTYPRSYSRLPAVQDVLATVLD